MKNTQNLMAEMNEYRFRQIDGLTFAAEHPITVSFEYRKKDGETRRVKGKFAAVKPEFALIKDEDRGGAFRAFRFDGMLNLVKVY